MQSSETRDADGDDAPEGRSRRSRPGLGAQLARAGLCLALYVLLEWLSFIHEYKGLPITPWNPGLGVVFALMVTGGGLWGGAVLFAGVLVAEFFILDSELRWPLIIALGAVASSSYALIATAVHERFRLDATLIHLRDILLLLGAGLAAGAITSLLVTMVFLAVGQFETGDVLQAAISLGIGDVIGISVMTPLMLRFVLPWRIPSWRWLLPHLPEMLLYAVGIAATLLVIVGGEDADGYWLFYLLFLPVVAAAVRYGLDGACLSLAAAQFGLVGLLHFYGYDAKAFTEFQTLMVVLTATGLIVGVVISERRNADDRARRAESLLKARENEAGQAERFNLVNSMASALAHEITQPMTAARAHARTAQHILRTPGGDLDRADSNLTTMIAQIDHAGRIVHRMRDFLRRGRLQVSTLEVRRMLDEALMLIRADAAAKQVRIELDLAGDLPLIHGDRIQLEQVVLNLVRNAIEAIAATGRSDGIIRIGAQRSDRPDHIEFSVRDNGPGIKDGWSERLFEPLTSSKDEGLGLGLAICASIVAAHGGRTWLHSGSPGATEFRFSIALEPPGDS